MQIFCSYIYFSVESRERRLLQNHCSPSRRPCLGHPPQQEVDTCAALPPMDTDTTALITTPPASMQDRLQSAVESRITLRRPIPKIHRFSTPCCRVRSTNIFPPSSSTTHPSLMDPERSGAGQDACRPQGQSVTQPCERERSRLCFSRRASGLVGLKWTTPSRRRSRCCCPKHECCESIDTVVADHQPGGDDHGFRLRPGWQLHHP